MRESFLSYISEAKKHKNGPIFGRGMTTEF